jgi:hypothetical protein
MRALVSPAVLGNEEKKLRFHGAPLERRRPHPTGSMTIRVSP